MKNTSKTFIHIYNLFTYFTELDTIKDIEINSYKFFIRHSYEAIRGIQQFTKTIEELINHSKSIILKSLKNVNVNYLNVFQKSIKKCTICKDQLELTKARIFTNCLHKMCPKCYKKFPLSKTFCPFDKKIIENENMVTDNGESLITNHQILSMKIISKLIDLIYFTKANLPNIHMKHPKDFFQLNDATFVTQYYDCAIVTHELAIFFNYISVNNVNTFESRLGVKLSNVCNYYFGKYFNFITKLAIFQHSFYLENKHRI